MIETRNLTKRYDQTLVIDDISIDIPPTGITSIIGPNGAGKSTLLALISRLLPMSAGTVTVGGLDITKTPSAELARKLSILRQDNYIMARLTVRDLVSFGRYPHSKGRLTTADLEHIQRALHYLELDEVAHRFLDELSGGQRQRVFVAMVLCQDTDCVLLDEPLNHLDIRHAVTMMKLIRKAADEMKKMFILVMHDINFASYYSDYIIGMKEGKIFWNGTKNKVMTPENIGLIYDIRPTILKEKGFKFYIYFD